MRADKEIIIKIDEDVNRMYAIIDKNIDNNSSDIEELIKIQYTFLEHKKCKRIYFEFTDCDYINAAVSVIIGTLPVYSVSYGKSVKYQFGGHQNHPILKFMKNVGMYRYFTKDELDYTGKDVIPFNCIKNERMMEEYTDLILNLAPVKLMREAKDVLTSYIYEIYQNGIFHSESPIGVFTSGIWLKEKKEFNFSIYDMGLGIPQNVRNFLKKNDIDSEKCLKIAFLDGFSTSDNKRINRGLGLTRLENFIKLNHGSMSIYTEDICCIIDDLEEKRFIRLKYPIKGTLIIINIIADENHIYVIDKEK